MADKNSGSVIQIIHETAYALAKKEMNLKEDDKQDQVKLAALQIRIGQNEEEISEKIDLILKQIKTSFNGTVMPAGIDMEAAENVLNQVIENGLTSPSEINSGEDVAKECLIGALQNPNLEIANNELKNESPKFVELLAMHINKKIEDKVDIDKINHPIVKGDFSNGGIEVEFPDGTKAIFENPIGELRKLYRRRNWR